MSCSPSYVPPTLSQQVLYARLEDVLQRIGNLHTKVIDSADLQQIGTLGSHFSGSPPLGHFGHQSVLLGRYSEYQKRRNLSSKGDGEKLVAGVGPSTSFSSV